VRSGRQIFAIHGHESQVCGADGRSRLRLTETTRPQLVALTFVNERREPDYLFLGLLSVD